MSETNGTIVVAGSVAQKPHRAGHTWVFLNYLLGLRKLGWDVLFIDRLEPGMCVDTAGTACRPEQSVNLSYFMEVMERFELRDACAVLLNGGASTIGLSRREVLDRTRSAACVLNIMGFLTDTEILERAARRIFVDIESRGGPDVA